MKRHLLGALLTLAACTDTSGLTSTPPDASAEGGGAPADSGASDANPGGGDGDAPASVDAYAKAVLADAPIAFFRLRETSGGACANEIAGSTITCVYPSIGATRGAAGISSLGKSVRFDDASATLTLYGLAAWEGQVTFTVEAWIHYDKALSNFFARMDNGGTSMRSGSWSYSDTDAGGNVFVTETWNTGTIIFGSRTDIPTADDFMHLAYAFDATLSRDVTYLNATKGGDYFTGGGGTRVAASSPLTFGGFKGSIAEIAIYDKRLAPDRIAAHYAAR